MRLTLIAALALTSCVSAKPLAPDPSVDLRGEWRVTAVNGQPTPGGQSYFLSYTPPTGQARFGCNAGGGAARLENGWLVTGDWIVTAAGCPNVRREFERDGFDILAQPVAIERSGAAIRLRNLRGTIDLVRSD